jgi:hypothetical protein
MKRGDTEFQGDISAPDQIGFSAYRNAARLINTSTWSDVLCDTELYDYGSNYNTSDGRFTCDVAGRYLFTGVVTMIDIDAGIRFIVSIYKNGAAVNRLGMLYSGTANGDFCINGSLILELDVDDYVELYCNQNSGGQLSLDPGYNTVYFQGIKLA